MKMIYAEDGKSLEIQDFSEFSMTDERFEVIREFTGLMKTIGPAIHDIVTITVNIDFKNRTDV